MKLINGPALLLLIFAALAVPLASDTGHQRWSETMFEHVRNEYGEMAERRMRMLEQLIADNYGKPVRTKLEVTNQVLNQLPWIADRTKYHVNDYWASPIETIATFGGDCEDIAIAKFVMLRHMGVAAKHLHLAYVKVKQTGAAHMVMLYVENPEETEPDRRRALVLDNTNPAVLPGQERPDLIAVYAVDKDNNVTVFNDDGLHRSVAAKVSNAKYAKLDKIKEKIAADRAKYKALNGGREFF